MKKILLTLSIILIVVSFVSADFYTEINEPLNINKKTSIDIQKVVNAKHNKKIIANKKHKQQKGTDNNYVIKYYYENKDKNKNKIVFINNELKEYIGFKCFSPLYYVLNIKNPPNNPFVLLTNRQIK